MYIWNPDQLSNVHMASTSQKWKKSPNSCKYLLQSLLYIVIKIDMYFCCCSTENWVYISVHTAWNSSEPTNIIKMKKCCLLILKSNQYISIFITNWNESTHSNPGKLQVIMLSELVWPFWNRRTELDINMRLQMHDFRLLFPILQVHLILVLPKFSFLTWNALQSLLLDV